ncbi:hypothetical protein QTI11_14750 [Clostridium perfringens]|nr:hypothetical protein [Clostridium perfringens]
MKEIKINVDNYNENSIKTIEGNNLSEVYKIYICKNKRRIDLTNKIAIMAYVNEYGNKKSDILALNITNASQGEIELPITNVISSENGVYACQIAIYGENNSLEQTAPFSLIVENNIFSKISNSAINNSDFHILSEAIKTTNAYGEKLKQGTENIELQYANKLHEINSQLDNTYDKQEVDGKVFHMVNMGQDVKEAMTGGSVAVVGENAVGTENIQPGATTYEKINQDAINSLRSKNIIPDIFKWEGNTLMAIKEGFIAGFNKNKYRWIKEGLKITLDGAWNLVYFDARDGHELQFHKVDDWKNISLDLLTNPNIEVVAFRSGNNKTCYYIDKNNYNIEINSNKNKINEVNKNNFINGFDVIVKTGLNLEIAPGSINNVVKNNTTPLTLKSLYNPQSFNYKTIIYKEKDIVLNSNYKLPARFLTDLVVKNENDDLLVEGDDYTVTTDSLGITKIRDNKLNSRVVNLSYKCPMCRIDTLLLDVETGEILIKTGINSNNNPTVGLWDIPKGKFRLGYIFLRWGATSIKQEDIYLTKDVNLQGETALDNLYNKNFSKECGNKLFRFYSKIESMLSIQSYARKKPIRIGIIGDSTCQNNQDELILESDNKYYGWTNFLCDMLHKDYPNAKITMYRCYANNTPLQVRNYEKQGECNLEIEIYNYAQGGHTLYQFLFDEHNHFKDNDINHVSPCFINGKENYHDLMFLCRTNWMLEDTFLKEQSVREKFQSEPYNLKLHEISDYENKELLIEDNSEVYKILLKEVANTVKKQGADLVFVSSTPDSALNFEMYTKHEASSAMMSELEFEICKEFNSIFVNLFPIFTKSVEKNGLPLQLMYLPQGQVHPGMYMHKRIADEVFKIFNKNTY